jgi:hypothetical protein
LLLRLRKRDGGYQAQRIACKRCFSRHRDTY